MKFFHIFYFQKSVEKSALPCYNIPICLGLAHASRWIIFKSWSSLAAMTRDCKSLGLHLRRFESYLQHHSCLYMTRRLSSVVEHFHGKEGVSSSNLEGGSMKRNKNKERSDSFLFRRIRRLCTKYTRRLPPAGVYFLFSTNGVAAKPGVLHEGNNQSVRTLFLFLRLKN